MEWDLIEIFDCIIYNNKYLISSVNVKIIRNENVWQLVSILMSRYIR